MTKEVIYVSGKISALTPEQIKINQDLGVQKGAELAKQGYAPIIPHANLRNIHEYESFTYRDYMEMDFAHLKKSDIVYMMNGWEDSNGAKREERYARLLHKKIIYEGK